MMQTTQHTVLGIVAVQSNPVLCDTNQDAMLVIGASLLEFVLVFSFVVYYNIRLIIKKGPNL